MTTVNIHDAKTQLSKLVDQATRGEPVVIAKAGKPLVRITALDAPTARQRTGFLKGEIEVPDDFATMSIDSLPPLHKDPFDRMLVAQAVSEGITLLTRDTLLAKYPAPVRKV